MEDGKIHKYNKELIKSAFYPNVNYLQTLNTQF